MVVNVGDGGVDSGGGKLVPDLVPMTMSGGASTGGRGGGGGGALVGSIGGGGHGGNSGKLTSAGGEFTVQPT